MANPQQYDAIVIGAGQAGGPLATALAQAGKQTALIEREHVGGTCINVGCTPTKTMVASARVAYLARRAAEYGVVTGDISINLETVRERKRAMVESFRSGSQHQIEATEGVDLLMGEASFVESHVLQVQVNGGEAVQLTAETIIINAGGRNALPPIDGIEQGPTLDSTAMMELDRAPGHLMVLGGGYIGMEFAQMFRRFGSAVTLIQRGKQVLPLEDPDIAAEVVEILRGEGVRVMLEASAQRAVRTSTGGVALFVETPAGEEIVAGSRLLVAVGRRPNTDWLHVDAAGLETDTRGYLVVNDRLETNIPGIYAAGDIKGGPAFTHVSYDDFRVLRTNLLQGGSATISQRLLPYTVFLDPQLGRIGLTEKQAREQGYDVRVARMPMRHVARALEADETRGMMKAVVDAQTGQILGAAVLGIEGGEIAGAIQLAMLGNLPYTALRDGMFSHPTLLESLNNLFSLIEE